MGKNYITAAEANTLNKTTGKLISIVFRSIKDEAEHGHSEFTFDTMRVALVAFNNLKDELTNAGFKLSYYYPEYSEEIDYFQEDIVEGKVPMEIKVAW